MLVAENEVVGILVLLPDDGAMLLDNVAVHPDRHGRGYGRALIAFAERVARERGFKAIRLYTNEAMTRTSVSTSVWDSSKPIAARRRGFGAST